MSIFTCKNCKRGWRDEGKMGSNPYCLDCAKSGIIDDEDLPKASDEELDLIAGKEIMGWTWTEDGWYNKHGPGGIRVAFTKEGGWGSRWSPTNDLNVALKAVEKMPMDFRFVVVAGAYRASFYTNKNKADGYPEDDYAAIGSEGTFGRAARASRTWTISAIIATRATKEAA